VNTPTALPAGDFPPKLSQPALRALAAAGFTRLEQLAAVREADLKKLHGIGPNALAQLRSALAERGLAFAGEDRTSKKDP
jgi:hypothetical protein